MEKLPAQPIKGLQDGIVVLQQLANTREPISSLELSNELGIETTRVNRILKTLTSLGIAYRTTSRKYTSGSGMHVLAAQSLAASGLFHTSVRHLEDLSELGHLTALGVLWRDKVSYLFHHASGTPFQEGVGRTQLYPATQSSLGMVLMAQKSDKEISDLYIAKEEIEGFKDFDELLREICEIRKSGYAVLKNQGNLTIAVKIGAPAYAAIGISGKINKKDIKKYVDILQEKTLKIEEELRT